MKDLVPSSPARTVVVVWDLNMIFKHCFSPPCCGTFWNCTWDGGGGENPLTSCSNMLSFHFSDKSFASNIFPKQSQPAFIRAPWPAHCQALSWSHFSRFARSLWNWVWTPINPELGVTVVSPSMPVKIIHAITPADSCKRFRAKKPFLCVVVSSPSSKTSSLRMSSQSSFILLQMYIMSAASKLSFILDLLALVSLCWRMPLIYLETVAMTISISVPFALL